MAGIPRPVGAFGCCRNGSTPVAHPWLPAPVEACLKAIAALAVIAVVVAGGSLITALATLPAVVLVLQRRFLNPVNFWPEIASRKARPQSCRARGQVAMKGTQDPFLAIRRCNTRSLAGKPLAGFCATRSRPTQGLYGMVVHVIRCNTHYFIDNRR